MPWGCWSSRPAGTGNCILSPSHSSSTETRKHRQVRRMKGGSICRENGGCVTTDNQHIECDRRLFTEKSSVPPLALFDQEARKARETARKRGRRTKESSSAVFPSQDDFATILNSKSPALLRELRTMRYTVACFLQAFRPCFRNFFPKKKKKNQATRGLARP